LPPRCSIPASRHRSSTKAKARGRDNSYVERYEEDWSYLRDPTLSTDPFFDPLKYIPLGPGNDVHMTLNGEIRFRYDNTDQKNFAIAPSVTPGTALKGLVFTPATGVSSNQLLQATLRTRRRSPCRALCPLLRRALSRPADRA
jgi:hypothetical protein